MEVSNDGPDSDVMPDNGAVTQDKIEVGDADIYVRPGVLLDEFPRYTRRATVTWHIWCSWTIFSPQLPLRLGLKLFELCNGSDL
jgi:hypothetical protein